MRTVVEQSGINFRITPNSYMFFTLFDNLNFLLLLFFAQEVALLDVRKEIDFCKKVGLPILGLVQNMSYFVCPKCQVCLHLLIIKLSYFRVLLVAFDSTVWAQTYPSLGECLSSIFKDSLRYGRCGSAKSLRISRE